MKINIAILKSTQKCVILHGTDIKEKLWRLKSHR